MKSGKARKLKRKKDNCITLFYGNDDANDQFFSWSKSFTPSWQDNPNQLGSVLRNRYDYKCKNERKKIKLANLKAEEVLSELDLPRG